MKTVLILTVGGSHQPILKSLEQHQPVFVYFVCSSDFGKFKGSYVQVIGEGKVLTSKFEPGERPKPDLPNLVTLAKLRPDQFECHNIDQFDDLNGCYLNSWKMIEKARRTFPDAQIVVDYTGGTKSMTAGLAAAALDDGHCEISLVAGRRTDLVKVQDRTEFVRPIQVWDAQALRRLRSASALLQRFDYAAAEHTLRDAAARYASERTVETLERGIALCRAFDAWDKFDHQTAFNLLEPFQREFVSLWRFLKSLLGKSHGHGFEAVEDLLRNAERRASQDRFDDAAGRLYRAIELTAQLQLTQQHKLDTSDINLEFVPSSLRADIERHRNEEGSIKIGLLLAWDVLSAIANEPLGQAFLPKRRQLLNFLSIRNSSLLAHGLTPVTLDDYQKHAPGIVEWLSDCITTAATGIGIKHSCLVEQLPTAFLVSEP